MRYRVHIEMSRDGYPLLLQTALLVGGSSQGVAKARALELARAEVEKRIQTVLQYGTPDSWQRRRTR